MTSSPFERLWAGAAEGLPKPEQVVALPGRSQVHSLRRDPSARYLAVAANFRERDGGSDGRALVRLPSSQNECGPRARAAQPIELTLADYGVHLPGVQDGSGRVQAAVGAPSVLPVTVLLRADGSVAAVLPIPFRSADEVASVVEEHLGVAA